MVFNRLFGRKDPSVARRWQLPVGERIYAIGDIHGRLDLLDLLLGQIANDNAKRAPAKTRYVFLGDLADRGIESKGVIERLMWMRDHRPGCVFLAGNHEELLIRVWEGDRPLAATFHRAGGRETLMSYGVSAEDYDSWDLGQVTEATSRLVPRAHIDFLKSFTDWHRSGDYLFVHAGIRPGIDIEDQDVTDLRWIRGDFVRSDVDHGMLVIHGHTITKDIDERPNRIGIDTGAYESGKLSAIGIEGTERWFLQT
jgi:serine/threonine protein phosphatase 1